jgi:hypothetical protein
MATGNFKRVAEGEKAHRSRTASSLHGKIEHGNTWLANQHLGNQQRWCLD